MEVMSHFVDQNFRNIHPDAKIAEGVTIDPFATIEADVEIGEGTWIGSSAIIGNGARIGKNCKIYPSAMVSSDPQDNKYGGENTTTHIGDHTVIREFVTISRGTTDKLMTVIGSNCLIMAYVHVAHDCIIGDNVILVNSVQIAGHVTVDDWAIIGGGTAIHQFSKIGAHVIISGASIVVKDVPPYIKAGKEPLAYCGINAVGLKRRGFVKEQMDEIQEVYRYVYQRGLNTSDAVGAVKENMADSADRNIILDFIKGSDRGIMKN